MIGLPSGGSDVETVNFDIGVDHGLFTFRPQAGVAVLHANKALVAFFIEVFEDALVVNLSRGWFVAARVVSDLDVGNLLPGPV